jgi:CUB domain
MEAPEGEIISPGYPDSQAKRQVCTWLITVPAGRQIKVEFVDFDLDGSRTTCQQWLGVSFHTKLLKISLHFPW